MVDLESTSEWEDTSHGSLILLCRERPAGSCEWCGHLSRSAMVLHLCSGLEGGDFCRLFRSGMLPARWPADLIDWTRCSRKFCSNYHSALHPGFGPGEAALSSPG